MSIELLVLLALLQGLVVAAVQPLRLAIVPSLVERPEMGAAIAISSIMFNVSRFVGPGLAGLIIAKEGVDFAFSVCALTAIPTVIAFAAIRLAPPTPHPQRSADFLGQLAEGLRYSRARPRIGRLLAILAVLSGLARSAVEFLPAFADQVFARGVAGLAGFTAAIGLGAALAGMWVATRKGEDSLMRLTVASATLTALALALFALTSSYPLGLALIGMSGMFAAAAGISTQTLIQLGSEDHMRGRIMSLWSSIHLGGPAAGALVMGLLIEVFGLRETVAVASAIAVALLVLLGARLIRGERTPAGQPE